MDPSSLCSQGFTQSEAFLGNGGLNQGGSDLPLKCSGIDQVRPSLGSQLQWPFEETTNQVQLLQQQGQFLQAVARGSSFQASSQKVRVDSQDQEELTMEASIRRFLLPINPSSLYSQGVTQPNRGLVNGGGSLAPLPQACDHINVIESQTLKVQNKRKKKITSSVWQSYQRITEEDGKERAQCIKCGMKYRIDSEKIGTSTLNRHLKKCLGNETHDVVLLEPMDQELEPIQEENIIELRNPVCLYIPQAQIRPSPASGVLGTTPAATSKRRRLAEMQTESDKLIWSKTSAFQPTSHESANKSAGTEADEGKSSTPAATEGEVQAPRDLQLSLATTKSGPQEESGSVHKQFASADELRSIGEQKRALKITLNGILDSLSKGQMECLGRCKIAVDVVLSTVGSAVDVKPLEAIFTELFASCKQWQSIQDPASLYQNEVLDRVAILRGELENEKISSFVAGRERIRLYNWDIKRHIENIDDALAEVRALEYDPEWWREPDGERESFVAGRERIRLYIENSENIDDVLSKAWALENGAKWWGEPDGERDSENEEQSSWIDKYSQLLLDMDKSLKHIKILWAEAAERLKGFPARVASKLDRLKAFDSMVEGILGVGLESADPEAAALRYAAHKREAMKAQLQDFYGKINDFFKE